MLSWALREGGLSKGTCVQGHEGEQNKAVLHRGKASLNPELRSCVILGKLLDLSELPFSHYKRQILEELSSQDCREE